jgi:hypothetical protein
MPAVALLVSKSVTVRNDIVVDDDSDRSAQFANAFQECHGGHSLVYLGPESRCDNGEREMRTNYRAGINLWISMSGSVSVEKEHEKA